jgi:hypothetical protein
LLAKAFCQSAWMFLTHRIREQAHSHRSPVRPELPESAQNLWERPGWRSTLLAKAFCQSAWMFLTHRIREQAHSHRSPVRPELPESAQNLWERACSRKHSVSQPGCSLLTAFVSKLSPTGPRSDQSCRSQHRIFGSDCSRRLRYIQPKSSRCAAAFVSKLTLTGPRSNQSRRSQHRICGSDRGGAPPCSRKHSVSQPGCGRHTPFVSISPPPVPRRTGGIRPRCCALPFSSAASGARTRRGGRRRRCLRRG